MRGWIARQTAPGLHPIRLHTEAVADRFESLPHIAVTLMATVPAKSGRWSTHGWSTRCVLVGLCASFMVFLIMTSQVSCEFELHGPIRHEVSTDRRNTVDVRAGDGRCQRTRLRAGCRGKHHEFSGISAAIAGIPAAIGATRAATVVIRYPSETTTSASVLIGPDSTGPAMIGRIERRILRNTVHGVLRFPVDEPGGEK